MSVWNPDNVRDVSESVGIASLSEEVLKLLSSDIEFRLSQVLEEALRFMRHGKRSTLTTRDINRSLEVLNVEPLYGYESTRPLRFGEASIGPGQPLFYVEDEEVDFEKLINAPLPKIPREISLTGHWLAIDGVQPSIPQNPTSADSRNQELLPKGPGANPNLATINGNDNVSVKPQVKHVLSKELQLYFEKICGALLGEANDEYRAAAFASLRSDPGLHQLVPYFVQFVAEKVTHNLNNMFVLSQTMQLASALLDNQSLFIEPYISALVPPVLTCLTSPHIVSPPQNPMEHYNLRALAGSLLTHITKKYSQSSHTLKPRLARTCLKTFLDPNKTFAVHYGALLGLQAAGGREVVRVLIVPNLKEYCKLLQEAFEMDLPTKPDAEMVVVAIMRALESLEEEGGMLVNGYASGNLDEYRGKVEEKVGEFIAGKVLGLGRPQLVQAILE
ncbi:hypothetical protein MMC14_006782 [Varicellaria rhodocarpa]|nr:hypothetical protein [Varicellaria rhodocarpa]